MTGSHRGIQGYNNSCYLDVTLFSLFAYSSCIDRIVLRPRDKSDIAEYVSVQKLLMEEIVNTLRFNGYVSAHKITKLRTCLDSLGSVQGLVHEEKDPEELIRTLFSEVLDTTPFFEVRQPGGSLQPCYFHQIFMDVDHKMTIPDTQSLLERSFIVSDIKLVQVPHCLILQMPRSGNNYKMYNRLRPSLTIKLNDILDKASRVCSICGNLAFFECKLCSLERCINVIFI